MSDNFWKLRRMPFKIPKNGKQSGIAFKTKVEPPARMGAKTDSHKIKKIMNKIKRIAQEYWQKARIFFKKNFGLPWIFARGIFNGAGGLRQFIQNAVDVFVRIRAAKTFRQFNRFVQNHGQRRFGHLR